MTINLKGGAQLSAFLQAFPANVQRNAVNAGLRKGAAVVRDQARANVPKKTGQLAKAIKVSSPRKNEDGVLSIKVQLKGKHSYIAPWLEYGTAAHLITAGDANLSVKALNKRAKKSGVLGKTDSGLVRVGGYEYMAGPRGSRDENDMLKINDKFVGGAVMHPGITPRPFLRPALDTKAGEVIAVMGQAIGDYLKNKTGFSAPILGVDDE